MISAADLKAAWIKFDKGDHVSDRELDALIANAKEGQRYLHARGERFVSSRTSQDLMALEGYQRARKDHL